MHNNHNIHSFTLSHIIFILLITKLNFGKQKKHYIIVQQGFLNQVSMKKKIFKNPSNRSWKGSQFNMKLCIIHQNIMKHILPLYNNFCYII